MSDRLPLRDLGKQPLPAIDDALAPDAVGPGRQVTLYFSLSLPDGEEIDSNFGRQPACFVVGDGNLLPGFEAAIRGFRPGRRRHLTLSPAQAFGEVNEDNIQRFPRRQFDQALALSPGLMIAFQDASGYEQAGVVKHFDQDWVEVDFNHPLAGREVIFSVEILSVEAVSESSHE